MARLVGASEELPLPLRGSSHTPPAGDPAPVTRTESTFDAAIAPMKPACHQVGKRSVSRTADGHWQIVSDQAPAAPPPAVVYRERVVYERVYDPAPQPVYNPWWGALHVAAAVVPFALHVGLDHHGHHSYRGGYYRSGHRSGHYRGGHSRGGHSRGNHSRRGRRRH